MGEHLVPCLSLAQRPQRQPDGKPRHDVARAVGGDRQRLLEGEPVLEALRALAQELELLDLFRRQHFSALPVPLPRLLHHRLHARHLILARLATRERSLERVRARGPCRQLRRQHRLQARPPLLAVSYHHLLHHLSQPSLHLALDQPVLHTQQHDPSICGPAIPPGLAPRLFNHSARVFHSALV
eukprot:3409624-Rhodomonas_salina.1